MKRTKHVNKEGKAKARKVLNKIQPGSRHHMNMFLLENTKEEEAKANRSCICNPFNGWGVRGIIYIHKHPKHACDAKKKRMEYYEYISIY